MMAQRAVGHLFRFPMFDQLDFTHTRGRAQVIHDRIGLVESLGGEYMLVSDAFVFVTRSGAIAMKPDMMLSRNLTELLIIRHRSSFKLWSTPHPTLSSSPRGEANYCRELARKQCHDARYSPLPCEGRGLWRGVF